MEPVYKTLVIAFGMLGISYLALHFFENYIYKKFDKTFTTTPSMVILLISNVLLCVAGYYYLAPGPARTAQISFWNAMAGTFGIFFVAYFRCKATSVPLGIVGTFILVLFSASIIAVALIVITAWILWLCVRNGLGFNLTPEEIRLKEEERRKDDEVRWHCKDNEAGPNYEAPKKYY
jgi:hypothetical protein